MFNLLIVKAAIKAAVTFEAKADEVLAVYSDADAIAADAYDRASLNFYNIDDLVVKAEAASDAAGQAYLAARAKADNAHIVYLATII